MFRMHGLNSMSIEDPNYIWSPASRPSDFPPQSQRLGEFEERVFGRALMVTLYQNAFPGSHFPGGPRKRTSPRCLGCPFACVFVSTRLVPADVLGMALAPSPARTDACMGIA